MTYASHTPNPNRHPDPKPRPNPKPNPNPHPVPNPNSYPYPARDRESIRAERHGAKLARQLIELQAGKDISEATWKEQLRGMEEDQKRGAKEKRQYIMDKAALQEQIDVCRTEQLRLNLRKEEIRKERVKLRDLFVTGRQKINEGLESQTQFVDEATKVRDFPASLVFFMFSFFVDSLISLLV